jgi:ubiquinone/menaquinone biosynthesis C-methylase UbiE
MAYENWVEEIMLVELESTAERVVPGKSDYEIYQEHIKRYVFASNYTKNKIVLDNACGTGYGAWYMLKKGDAKEVVGVDISEDAINYAKNNYTDENISFICADAADLPFSKKYFDVVVSFETIEHLKDNEKFLSECNRVLKNGGIFICSTPNKKIYSPYSEVPLNPFHIREFYPQEFYELISKYFTNIDLYGQHNINLIKRSVFRFGRKMSSIIPNGDAVRTVIKSIICSNKNIGENKDEKSRVERPEEIIDKKYEVSGFRNNPITTPTYIIIVARKNEKVI